MRARISWLLVTTALLYACGDDSGGTSSGTDMGSGGGDMGVALDMGMPPPPPPMDMGAAAEGGGEGGMMMTGAAGFQNACAPDDGPALGITVARAGGGCMPDLTQEYLSFLVYDGLPIMAPATVMIEAATAQAQLCMDDDAGPSCTPATSGTLTFTVFEADMRATGTFSIVVDGNTLEGSFDAIFCDVPVMCG